MGNGRAVLGKGLLGEGLQGGRLQGKISGRSWRPVRITGAALILVLLAGAMVGWGSRRYAQTARAAGFRIPAFRHFRQGRFKSRSRMPALYSANFL